MPSGIENRQAVFGWLNTFLRDIGLQFSQSGFKNPGMGNAKHTIDAGTGFWGDPQYSRNKPPRFLIHVDVRGAAPVARLPQDLDEIGIGGSNTAQSDKAGLAVRILPILQTGNATYEAAHDFEANALFLFHGPLSGGSSSDAFAFNVSNGVLSRSLKNQRHEEPYIKAAVIGLRPRTDTMTVNVNGAQKQITYGQVLDAVSALIKVHVAGGTLTAIPVYDLSDSAKVEDLKNDLKQAWADAGPLPQNDDEGDADAENGDATIDTSEFEIAADPSLLGIDASVYRQINALLKSGKQHIMLYGPPGTGKTSLARWIASSLPGGRWTLVTGSSDWSSQDIIGGYQPVGAGNVDFVPGILLKDFDRPLIIDELNRCDIDKVIGPLFTVLSGQQTTLPYRTDLTDKHSQPYTILPKPKASKADHEFAPGPAWRLIATINSIDKASLYQMSYALSRRFGWVYVDAPQNLSGFVGEYLTSIGVTVASAADDCPLAKIWEAINGVRVIGPAPIIDCINVIRQIAPEASFFGAPDTAMKGAILDAIDMALLPMLDGIGRQDAAKIAETTTSTLGLTGGDAERLQRRVEAISI